MISSEFRKEEYWLIKWPLLCLVLSVLLSVALLVGLNAADAAAAADMRRARSSLDVARNQVDMIEQEESTIVEYIDRYRKLVQDNVVANEDRLQFQEDLAAIRKAFNLFPVNLNIGEQNAIPLQRNGNAERQVALQTSLVQITLPLLHENDLARLLVTLLDGPGLVQPLSCTLAVNNTEASSFIYLAQHFSAVCSLQWYTFRLPETE